MAGRLFPAGGGSSIPLRKRVMIIGRAAGCDIRLSDGVVSNRHCRLEFDGRVWTAADEGSRNGTMINTVPVGPARQPLKAGDTLIISAKFRLVIEYDPAVERRRFPDLDGSGEQQVLAGDDRTHLEHGPATNRLEPHDKDVWSQLGR